MLTPHPKSICLIIDMFLLATTVESLVILDHVATNSVTNVALSGGKITQFLIRPNQNPYGFARLICVAMWF